MTNKASATAGLIGWLKSPLTILSLFLILLSLTGGTSAAEARQLVVLRPVAILVAAFELYGIKSKEWREYWPVWVIFGGAVALTAAHLVPLPYTWWTSLPGRGVIADIDAAVGVGKIARPLSMNPDATMNALLSLSVPLAVMSLTVRLSETEQRRLAGLLLVLIAGSAFIGLLQLSGMQIAFYNYDSAEPLYPSGLLNNRNHQGALLALTFPLATLAWGGGYGWNFRSGIERFSAVALSLFVLPLEVVTGSRSGFIVAAIGFTISLLTIPTMVRRPNKRLTEAGKYTLGFAVFGAIIYITIYASRDMAIARFAYVDQDLRLPLWRSIMQALPSYWPWGTGVGTYVDAYQILEPDKLLRPRFSNNAHNDWLEVIFTAGAPGLFLLLTATIATAISAVKVMRGEPGPNMLARTGLMMILLIALASITDYPVRTPIISAMLAIAGVWAARLQRAVAQSG